VKQVLVRPGDRVQAGDLLAELEIGDLQVTSADLDLAIAQARLAQAEEANAHAIAQAEMALTLTQEQLALTEALRATYTAGTVAARVVLEQAEDQVARAEIEYQEALDRSWEPEEARDAYALALQQARWDLETAQAQYDQAVANEAAYQRELKIAEIGVQQAEAELEQLKGGIDPVLNLEVQRAQQALDYSQIVAPVDGEVISLSLYPGRPVEPFRTVIVIADPAVIEVSAGLSSDQLTDLTEGQKAIVTLSVNPERPWTGTVRRLPYPYGTGGSVESPAGIDSSTRISLARDVGGLKLGDLVRVTIVLEEKEDVLWLPADAVRTFQDRTFVIVQDGARQRRVDVEMGIEGQDQVEILKGLEQGQVVVAP
jgi:RND family efflux transporter MFP subunit